MIWVSLVSFCKYFPKPHICHNIAALFPIALTSTAALSDVLEAFKLPENATRLNEAHDNAGNDMLKSMQIVFPVLAQIQMEVIHKYGFMADGDGE